MSKKRLPRNRQVAPHERPRMVLTSRDKEIIKAVNDFRVLSAAQIEALFFSSRSTTQSRLIKLFHHGFLKRQFPEAPVGNTTTTAPLYTLGTRGAQILVDEFEYEPGQLRIARRDFAWEFIRHSMQINQFRIAIMLAARANGWEVEQWDDERVFRSHPNYVTVKDNRGKPQEKPVFPDGYFSLATPLGRAAFFIEIDRGKENEQAFRPQIEVYEAYYRSGQYQAHYGRKSVRILVVTTNERRLAKLKAITEKAGGDTKYCFTTFNQVSAETVLTQPIWDRIGFGMCALVPTSN